MRLWGGTEQGWVSKGWGGEGGEAVKVAPKVKTVGLEVLGGVGGVGVVEVVGAWVGVEGGDENRGVWLVCGLGWNLKEVVMGDGM